MKITGISTQAKRMDKVYPSDSAYCKDNLGCPHCGNMMSTANLGGDGDYVIEFITKGMEIEMKCDSCYKIWIECYALVGYKIQGVK